MIAQEGYWKRVEISDIDSVSLKMKAGLYKCPPGVFLGSVKYAICCKSLARLNTHTHLHTLVPELYIPGTMNVQTTGQGEY